MEKFLSSQEDSFSCGDSIVEANVSLLRERSLVGQQKYGTTLEDDSTTNTEAWIDHALMEVGDLMNYLQKLKLSLNKKGGFTWQQSDLPDPKENETILVMSRGTDLDDIVWLTSSYEPTEYGWFCWEKEKYFNKFITIKSLTNGITL